MASIANITSDEEYLLALFENGLIDENDGVIFTGENALIFSHNQMGNMADYLIAEKKVPKQFRERLIKRYIAISEIAFDKIYKEFKNLLDHNSVGWCGPLIMTLMLAEASRGSGVTLATLCDLFEGFYEMAPKKGQQVLH